MHPLCSFALFGFKCLQTSDNNRRGEILDGLMSKGPVKRQFLRAHAFVALWRSRRPPLRAVKGQENPRTRSDSGGESWPAAAAGLVKENLVKECEMNGQVISNRLQFGIGAIMFVLGSMAGAQTAQTQPRVTASTIVFVCEHGSGKSVIAAAHFNQLASEKGLPYRAVSRGTKPDNAVAPAVRTGLAAEGIDVAAWRPKPVTDEDIRRAARVVSLATDLPAVKPFVKSKLLEWNDVPSLDQNYEAAREAIVQRVEKLVERLASNLK